MRPLPRIIVLSRAGELWGSHLDRETSRGVPYFLLGGTAERTSLPIGSPLELADAVGTADRGRTTPFIFC